MMRISIAERLRPYSHVPGTICLLPGTSFRVQVFPTLIRIYDENQVLLGEKKLEVVGPLKEFTVTQDLERGEMSVRGRSREGFISYKIRREEGGVYLYRDKAKEPLFETHVPFYTPTLERLSLGNHKAQDWEQIKRRLDLVEILPLWNRLGCMTPQKDGTRLQIECKPEDVVSKLTDLFLAGFQGMLVPQAKDLLHQGIPVELPADLLTQGAHFIRSLFFRQEGQDLYLLPLLPPEFHHGRYIQIPFSGGTIDIEWSKKVIRRLIIHSTASQQVKLHVRKVNKGRFQQKDVISFPFSLSLEKNCHYTFDNFS